MIKGDPRQSTCLAHRQDAHTKKKAIIIDKKAFSKDKAKNHELEEN